MLAVVSTCLSLSPLSRLQAFKETKSWDLFKFNWDGSRIERPSMDIFNAGALAVVCKECHAYLTYVC
jgi:hypothetical protein